MSNDKDEPNRVVFIQEGCDSRLEVFDALQIATLQEATRQNTEVELHLIQPRTMHWRKSGIRACGWEMSETRARPTSAARLCRCSS